MLLHTGPSPPDSIPDRDKTSSVAARCYSGSVVSSRAYWQGAQSNEERYITIRASKRTGERGGGGGEERHTARNEVDCAAMSAAVMDFGIFRVLLPPTPRSLLPLLPLDASATAAAAADAGEPGEPGEPGEEPAPGCCTVAVLPSPLFACCCCCFSLAWDNHIHAIHWAPTRIMSALGTII